MKLVCAVNFINLPHLHKKSSPAKRRSSEASRISSQGAKPANQLCMLRCSPFGRSSYYFQRARNVKEHLTVNRGEVLSGMRTCSGQAG